MDRLLTLARRVRGRVGSAALWNAVRPVYWATMSRLAGEDGVSMTLSDGETYHLDPTLFAWQPETFETEVMSVLLPAIGKDSIVYDIGAHVGLVTLMAARRVAGGRGHVYAFEPSPDNFALLERHLRVNGCGEHVTPVQRLVGDRHEADVAFSYRPGQFTANSLAYDLPDGRTAHLPMVTLDGMIAEGEISDPDVIKIDVEGYERAVLQGAADLLRRRSPLVLCALHPEPLAALATSVRDVMQDMSGLGYRAFDLAGVPLDTAGFQDVVFRKI